MNNMTQHNIRVVHETHGLLVDENFVNPTQFKLFLKMIQGCLVTKEDLTFFNGTDFLLHVPFKVLVSSVITTKTDYLTLTEQLINKSKIESPVTK